MTYSHNQTRSKFETLRKEPFASWLPKESSLESSPASHASIAVISWQLFRFAMNYQCRWIQNLCFSRWEFSFLIPILTPSFLEQSKIIQNLSYIWEIRQARCKCHARRRPRRCCGSVGFDEDTAWHEAPLTSIIRIHQYGDNGNCWGSMHALPMYEVKASAVSKQQKQTKQNTKRSSQNDLNHIESHRTCSPLWMSSVSRSGLKSRTGDTRSGTVHLRSWRLETGSSSSSKRLGTERQTHASCDSISWGGYAVRSAVLKILVLPLFQLDLNDVFWFVSSLDQEAQIGHFVVNRSKNGDLATGERTRLILFHQTPSNTGTFSSQVTNCSWSVPSCSRYPPLKENYWHVPCLQFHGSLQFKAF